MIVLRNIRLIIFLLAISAPAIAQQEITWEMLTDVTYSNVFNNESDDFLNYPEFGESVKALDGKEVFIRGYMLPLDPQHEVNILSRYAFAACFFCGNAGPESVIELRLKSDQPEFRMDQLLYMKGRLRLNQDNMFECTYILEDAEVYKK